MWSSDFDFLLLNFFVFTLSSCSLTTLPLPPSSSSSSSPLPTSSPATIVLEESTLHWLDLALRFFSSWPPLRSSSVMVWSNSSSSSSARTILIWGNFLGLRLKVSCRRIPARFRSSSTSCWCENMSFSSRVSGERLIW